MTDVLKRMTPEVLAGLADKLEVKRLSAPLPEEERWEFGLGAGLRSSLMLSLGSLCSFRDGNTDAFPCI